MILRRVFENVYRGFYVDVGAHHPQRFSNTYFFYESGWSGINIDAAPGSMAAFSRTRPRDVNLEVAIARDSEERTFFEFNEPALNSFDESLSRSRECDAYRIIREHRLKTQPLSGVLRQHLPPGQHIHFLTVDVEGLDFEVLQSNDWTAFRPSYVVLEHHGLTLENAGDSPPVALVRSCGYQLFAKTVSSLILQRRS